MVDYNKRLVEVDVVLNHLSESDYEKIPQEVIKTIKENMDQEYIWEMDETKELKDQNLSRDTIAILSYINMEYLLNEEQKALMQKIHEFNEKKSEKEKSEKYNPNDLFKNKESYIEKVEDTPKENTGLVVYKESMFSKILNKLKNIFRRK